jgi:N-acetylneuraminate synthase
MTPTLTLAGRTIGRGHPIYVIAEAGSAHGGDVQLGYKLIETAGGAGAHAVVFDVPRADGGGLSARDFKALLGQAQFVGVTAFGTVFDDAAVDLVASLDVAAVRVPSARRPLHPLLARAAQIGRPLFLSTDGADADEVREAIERCGTCPLALVASADLAEILCRHPDRPVGLRAPAAETEAREAVRRGASFVEKTYALNHRAEMTALVREVHAS